MFFMKNRNDRRETAIDKMANYVLSEGLAGATLRPLAAAAGTSDRMLLYYFADKDELLTAVLDRIAARLLKELEAAIPIGPRPFALLLEQVWAVLGSERLRPYMNVWLDLASGAARDLQPYRNAASVIVDGYLAWVTGRLEAQSDGTSPLSAALFISAVQGMYLLTAIGRPAIARAAMMELSAGVRFETDV